MIKFRGHLKIAHLHVADKNNKGDVAIVLAVQKLLRANFPGCKIIDYSVELLKTGGEKEIKKINQAGLIVIGGGGIFYSYFLPYNLEFIKALAQPIVIFGVGYIKEIGAPNLSREAVRSILALVKKSSAVSVRDFKTKEFLVKNGLKANKIKVIGDPAALLIEKKPPLAALKKLRLDKKNKKIKIGLNLNYSGWLGFGKWREDILASYREVAAYFLTEYGGPGKVGVEIYYLKHHPGENNIYPALKIKNLKVVDLKPAEQKYVYSQLDLVIGMMLHAGVLAFGAGIPEISVAYDLRNYSFAEFIGCQELVVDLDKLKKRELLKRTKIIFQKRKIYQQKFQKIKEKISNWQNGFLKNLSDLNF